ASRQHAYIAEQVNNRQEMDTKTSGDTRISYEWIALSVTTIGALMAAIDASAVIIALPTIMADLQADFITIMWVLLSYMLILAALVPVIGRLADMLGRKNLYNLGFIIFIVGSLLCGLSQPQFHGWDLVGYRMVQGVGGALLLTNSAVIVTDAFRKGRVGFGLGVNGIAFSAGFLLGPVVGGILTSISWRLVFLINVPIGIIGTIWGILQLREPVTLPTGQHFDWKGSLTFTVGLATLLLAVSLYAFPMTSAGVVYTLFVVAAVSLVLFVVAERRAPEPMLNLRLFKNRSFAYASAANGLNGLARGAVLFVLTFFLQGPYGYDPLKAGIFLAPFGAAFLVVGPISGHLSDRYGARYLATAGLLVSAVGLLGLCTVVSTTPYWVLAVWMAFMGGGSGLFASPNMNAIMSSVKPSERGIASGIRSMLMNTGQMLSIAIAFPLVLSQLPENVLYHVFLYGGGLGGTPQVLASFEFGMHEAFLVSAAFTLVAAIISFSRPSGVPRDSVAA
ncbi:MAG: MFS transporter, partial [Halobacteriota archaeon]